MKEDSIQISRALANQIFHMAQDTIRSDAILGGVDGKPCSLERVSQSTQNLSKALTGLSKRGETPLATVHIAEEHQPIETHLNKIEATWPEALRLLVLLDTKGVLELKLYRHIEGLWQALPLKLED